MCEFLFTNPKGKETSAVNSPAVDGTTSLLELQSFKVTQREIARCYI